MTIEEFSKLADTLSDMAIYDSKKKKSIDEIKREISSLKQKISEKKAERQTLERQINGDTYLDEEVRLDDQKDSFRLKKVLDHLYQKQQQLTKEIDALEQNIAKLTEDLSKKENRHDKLVKIFSSNPSLNATIEGLAKEIEDLKIAIETAKMKLSNVQSNLDEIRQEYEATQAKKLDLDTNISNPDKYIDKERKDRDYERLSLLEQEITELEKDLSSLETNPLLLAHKAITEFANNQVESAIEYLTPIVKQAEEIPYMTTPSSEKDKLSYIEENLTSERDSLYSAQKKSNNIVGLLNTRIAELKGYIKDFSSKDQEADIAKMNELLTTMSEKLSTLYSEQARLMSEIKIRQSKIAAGIEEDVKSTFENEIYALEQELEVIGRLIDSYLEEAEKLHDNIKNAESMLSKRQTENTAQKTALSQLELIQKDLKDSRYDKIKSLVSEEETTSQLNKVIFEVIGLKHRQKFDKSPMEILTMIQEAIYGPRKLDEPFTEEALLSNPADELLIPGEAPKVDNTDIPSFNPSELIGDNKEITTIQEPTSTKRSLSSDETNDLSTKLDGALKVVNIEPVPSNTKKESNPAPKPSDFTNLTGSSDTADLNDGDSLDFFDSIFSGRKLTK